MHSKRQKLTHISELTSIIRRSLLPGPEMLSDLPPPAIVCPAADERGQSAEAGLERARAARRAGDYVSAQCAAEHALSSEPQNADAWLELGLIRSVSGDADSARSAFLRVLDIAPAYDDARLGLARLAYRSGDIEEARAWLQRIDTARSSDPEVVELRNSLAAAQADRSVWRWDAFASYSTLSDDLSPWREASLAVSRREGPRSIGAGVEHVERFGQSDLYGEVNLAQRVRGGTWGLGLGGASHPSFKPEAAVRLEYASREDAAWIFGGALTLARYAVGQVDRLGLRATHRLGADLQANAQAIIVRDETDEVRAGYGVGGAWTMNDRLDLSLAWIDAPESSEGATVDVRSLGLSLAAEMAPSVRLRIGLLREERDAFDRIEFSLAIAKTF